MTITIEDFKPLQKNSLIGFARIRLASGIIFHDVSCHCVAGKYWANPPAKPAKTRDGTHLKKDGKPVWTHIVSFANKELRDKFSSAVIEALRLAHPEAFAE
jgi:hypothetical protein